MKETPQHILNIICIDLETTGLSPQEDTIIEIAAIKCQFQRVGSSIEIKNIEERTMLINPERELSEEVTLITGINADMLSWRKTWKEVQNNVAEFIGEDSVILGHNVAFDIAMLESHGITLSKHKCIDTFELAEIFSWAAESLNLGFLWDYYAIQKRWKEHRALTDTWVTVDLFKKYLEQSIHSHDRERDFNNFFFVHTFSPYSWLRDFLYTQADALHSRTEYIHSLLTTFETKTYVPNDNKKQWENPEIPQNSIYSLPATVTSEVEFLKKHANSACSIITPSKKSAIILSSLLERNGEKTHIYSEPYEFVSIDAIIKKFESGALPRKYSIFLLKMIYWAIHTETGKISECKYYGDEYNFLENFRLQPHETNFFLEKERLLWREAKFLIRPFCREAITQKNTYIKDIVSMEEIIRKVFSEKFSFEGIISYIEMYFWEYRESIQLIQAIRSLEWIIDNFLPRPTGPNVNPPGKFWETYFYTQQEFWSRGCKWLSIISTALISSYKAWKTTIDTLSLSRDETITLHTISKSLEALWSFLVTEYPNMGIIITIQQGQMRLECIERELNTIQKDFFKNNIAYGYALKWESIKKFIKTQLGEYTLQTIDSCTQTDSIISYKRLDICKEYTKVVVLTTSVKHIRELGKFFQPLFDQVLMQGTSWGKSKMQHYFSNNPNEKTVLIGLLESFKDEIKIFENADAVIFAKIPFDPPTDPYFLAKNIGVQNSFEIYTKPYTLARMNTLIATLHAIHPNMDIICSDSRIQTTEWGKYLRNHMV